MRVAVTGAGGLLGREVVSALLARHDEVIAIDVKSGAPAGARPMHADLCDLGQTYGALAGSEAVIHLAAIPAPRSVPPDVVFSTNVLSTFNVFEAAATLGIRRVVSASSVSALGFPWQHRWSEPLYLPVDEAHPLIPQDCYGLSKVAGEETAAAYCRRGAGSAASLRFATILSEETCQRHVDHARADPGGHAHLLWSYIDVRDAAISCVLALDASFEGHEPLYIIADDSTSDVPSDELIARYFPRVPVRAADRPAWWSLIDNSRAREVIGFCPRPGWRHAEGVQTESNG